MQAPKSKAGRQGPNLGPLSTQDKAVNQPLPQNSPCSWIHVTHPQKISLPLSQGMFTELGLTTCNCPPETWAGQIQFHKENWRIITNEPWLLDILSGYKIHFHSHPSQTYRPVISCSQKNRRLMEQEIASLQSK